jgi:hypothetical protein
VLITFSGTKKITVSDSRMSVAFCAIHFARPTRENRSAFTIFTDTDVAWLALIYQNWFPGLQLHKSPRYRCDYQGLKSLNIGLFFFMYLAGWPGIFVLDWRGLTL